MRRAVRGVEAVVAALVLTGCLVAAWAVASGPHPLAGSCQHVELDIAEGVAGQRTPQRAITFLIEHGHTGISLPAGPWTAAGANHFVNGSASVTTTRLRSGGYAVTAAATC
jgi:hypothetical protein